DGVHVDAVGQCLPDALVRETYCRGTRRVPADERVTEVLVLRDLDTVDGLHVGEVLRRDGPERELAGLETVRDGRRARDDLDHVLVDVGRALPIGRVLSKNDLVALAPLLEVERTADNGRIDVLRRVVDVLRLGGRGDVLAKNLRRQRVADELDDRGARDLRHL